MKETAKKILEVLEGKKDRNHVRVKDSAGYVETVCTIGELRALAQVVRDAK